ncbi:uncharacterized protein L969DRAFT_18707 [Mixia osmundae IAM 14324]|uniref:uncharacterized protein n=1 Tax=Mixia osmundae (strain CBS 9802 / IAM 14324 / JCM 22182 / KY 12970) TaxID=764103 RepID=UPI0004A5466F|nr:uncharacterized protein L969DRAFT_18707 [Mixia osmundae IAM 14324]KEI37917.1 hypothetical protein L969DRAFT_18707 [Mixia osmundae IAM 14324]
MACGHLTLGAPDKALALRPLVDADSTSRTRNADGLTDQSTDHAKVAHAWAYEIHVQEPSEPEGYRVDEPGLGYACWWPEGDHAARAEQIATISRSRLLPARSMAYAEMLAIAHAIDVDLHSTRPLRVLTDSTSAVEALRTPEASKEDDILGDLIRMVRKQMALHGGGVRVCLYSAEISATSPASSTDAALDGYPIVRLEQPCPV